MFDTIASLVNSEWLYTAFAAVALGSTIVISRASILAAPEANTSTVFGA